MIPILALLLGSLFASPASSYPTGHWEGYVIREQRYWRVEVDLVERDGETVALVDLPDYGIYARPFAVGAGKDGGVLLRFADGKQVVTIEGVFEGDQFRGDWEGLGVTAVVELDRKGPARPPLVEEPVAFVNGDVVLSGVLVKPQGAGPFPAVVWTHGSGNQTRATDFYRDRAYRLARAGVAGLIYDKRGCGASTGDRNATLYELAGDAVAAVQMLRARGDIVEDWVGVGGFSQGGYVAPLAAAQYGHIAFVVVGSAPGIAPAAQNDYAVERALERQGYGEDVRAEVRRLRAKVDAYRRTGAGQEDAEAAIERARNAPWFRTAQLPEPPVQLYTPAAIGVLDFDPLEAWARVRVPVFALWGEKDELVPALESKAAIQTALGRNKSCQLLGIAVDAGHGFVLVRPKDHPWDWPRLAQYHDALVAWVTEIAPHRSRSRERCICSLCSSWREYQRERSSRP